MNRYFIFCQGQLLINEKGNVPEGEVPPVQLKTDRQPLRLPAMDEYGCYAIKVETPVIVEGWKMVLLREAFELLPASIYKMAGKAYELIYWDETTKFCGVCGSPMELHTNISKRCTVCGREVWPSLATAIIVAVTRNEGREILLVQSNQFKKDYYGLVAGFVETGETLEECVRREVKEETGLTIRNLQYFASQPWPYPCGLMVGFTAELESGTLCLQRTELTKGGWFRQDNLPAIPGRVSLARRLIDFWASLPSK